MSCIHWLNQFIEIPLWTSVANNVITGTIWHTVKHWIIKIIDSGFALVGSIILNVNFCALGLMTKNIAQNTTMYSSRISWSANKRTWIKGTAIRQRLYRYLMSFIYLKFYEGYSNIIFYLCKDYLLVFFLK